MMNNPLPQLNPQEESLELLVPDRHRSVGLIKDFIPIRGILPLIPAKTAKIKEEGVQIWIERNYGSHASYTDLDFADAGGDILEDSFSVIQNSDILLKLEPFTLEEVGFLKPNQVIVSSLDISSLTKECFTIMKAKKITAFALDFIEDIDGNSILHDIFYREETPVGITVSLSNLTLPILLALALSSNLRGSIQTNPVLFQSLYCYNGEITKKEVAGKLDLPWKDFLSWYWNLN